MEYAMRQEMLLNMFVTIESRHDISNNVLFATSKGWSDPLFVAWIFYG